MSLPRTGQLVGASVNLYTSFPHLQGSGWIAPNPATGATATLQLALTTFVPPGVYSVIVTGVFNGASLLHSDTLVVTVAQSAAQDFSLFPQPNIVMLTRGAAPTMVALTLTRTNSFAGSIAFSVPNALPGVGVNFAPAIAASQDVSSLVSLAAAANAPPGIYALTIRGTSGALTRDGVITVVMN